MELEAPSHHPNPLPNTHHRKIELQSPLDLEYLRNNLLLSAQQKLDLNLPPSALRKTPVKPATFISLDGPHRDASASSQQPPPTTSTQSQSHQQPPEDLEDDPLRTRVQLLLSSFLTRTWTSAAQSITINGLDASSLPTTLPHPADPHTTAQQQPIGEREGIDFTYAPYDARLQAQVASLYGELESLTAHVSKLRREAPSAGAQRYSQQLRTQLATEEVEYEREMESLHDQQQQSAQDPGREHSEGVLDLDNPRPGYYQDMQATYARGVEELSRLAGVGNRDSGGGGAGQGQGQGGGSLTETVGKVQRARTVALEFE